MNTSIVRKNSASSLRGVAMTGAVWAAGLLGCAGADKIFCQNGNCSWSAEDATRIAALAIPSMTALTPPLDPSNQYVGNPLAQQLGQQLFSDARFSGISTGSDALGRLMPYARAAKGQPINVSCFTCHDLRRGGIDPATVPGNVSIGAGWTDVNSLTVINTAFQTLYAWNGRADSMWAQATGTIEAVMGSNRGRAAWTIASFYAGAYNAVFTDDPLPMTGTIATVTPTLATDAAHAGQCLLAPDCPDACRSVGDPSTGATACWPRFPLDARPGKKTGCQPGDSTEPYGDAYDCMDPADQLALTRVVVNFGKAIAAFEFQLVSNASPFDQFVADLQSGHARDSTAISPEAQNGALLFVGKAGCSDCHNTPLLTDGKFHNVGIPQVGPGVPLVADCLAGTVCDCVSATPSNCLPWGARDGIAKLHKNAFLRSSMWSDDPTDTSRQSYIDTPPESYPIGAFRTPSLREVALTAPYMHTGAFTSLEAVVAHYNQGADPAVDGDVAAQLKPLYLSDEEQSELVAFLKTLTGAPLASELANPVVNLPM